MNAHIKNKKNILFFIIFFLIIFKFFNTPYNAYSLVLWNYDKRMTQAYGFCKNESWGFYNYVINKYKLQNQKIKIINHEGYVKLDGLFNIIDHSNKSNEYIIILNFQSENEEDIYSAKVDNIKNYSIKYRFNNCYLMELND